MHASRAETICVSQKEVYPNTSIVARSTRHVCACVRVFSVLDEARKATVGRLVPAPPSYQLRGMQYAAGS